MSRNKKTTNWVKSHARDIYVKKSKRDLYRSRAAYKLHEINEKFNILGKVKSVADLGCAPGSWLQVLKEHENINFLIGIDLLEVEPIKDIVIAKCDIRDKEQVHKLFEKYNSSLDLVISDIAPNITGISDVDQSNFIEIANDILSFCRLKLKPRGTMIMKYFLGINFEDTMQMLNNNFSKINVFKPSASKKHSNEVYLICIEFKA